MVESHVVGITPAIHANEHRIGGSDPLTGAVGIDSQFVYDGSQVFTGNAPVAWTDLDLSAKVGSKKVLAWLLIRNNTAASVLIGFRAKGETDNFEGGSASCSGVSKVYLFSSATEASTAMCDTDANGIIQWESSAANNITIELIGYHILG